MFNPILSTVRVEFETHPCQWINLASIIQSHASDIQVIINVLKCCEAGAALSGLSSEWAPTAPSIDKNTKLNFCSTKLDITFKLPKIINLYDSKDKVKKHRELRK